MCIQLPWIIKSNEFAFKIDILNTIITFVHLSIIFTLKWFSSNKYIEVDFCPSPSPQTSLCIVNIDRGTLDCPEELPPFPDQNTFMIRLSEKILEHGVKVQDTVERPHSPEMSPPGKPSVIEALRCVCVCVCVCVYVCVYVCV